MIFMTRQRRLEVTQPQTIVVSQPSEPEKRGSKAGVIGGVVVIAGVATAFFSYEYTQYQKYVTAGGTLTYWQWLTHGMPSITTFGNISPTINIGNGLVSPLNLNSTISFNGSGYTPNSVMTLKDSLSGTSTHTTDGTGTFSTGTFNISTITTQPGTVTFIGVDSTGATSSALSVTFKSSTISGTGSGGGTTKSPQITASPASITSAAANSTQSITVTGSGFTGLGSVSLVATEDGNRVWGTTGIAGLFGNITISNISPVFQSQAETMIFTATDVATGSVSNSVSVSIVSASTTSSGGGTTVGNPGGTNTFGSSQNPYIATTQTGGPNYNWQGVGYYDFNGTVINIQDQNTFNAYSNALNATGMVPNNPVVSTVTTGSLSSPSYPYQPGYTTLGSITYSSFSWNGAGYYNFNGTATYVTDQSQISTFNSQSLAVAQAKYNATGTQNNPYPMNNDGTQTYVEAGYYSFNPTYNSGSGETYVSNPAYISAYNSLVLTKGVITVTPVQTSTSGTRVWTSPTSISKSNPTNMNVYGTGFSMGTSITLIANVQQLSITTTVINDGSWEIPFNFPSGGLLWTIISSTPAGGSVKITATDDNNKTNYCTLNVVT